MSMEPQGDGDSHSPFLPLEPGEEEQRRQKQERRRASTPHLRDLHILSFCFLLVFLAYGAIQNLESSLVTDQSLGSTALGVLYLSLTVSSFGTPLLVRLLGTKHALLLGLTGYWVFIAANFYPKWFTLIPASIYLGFTASVLWVAEGTYISYAAKSHAATSQMHENNVLGDFNGEFWGVYFFHQVIGNLLTLALLKDDSSGTVPLFLVFLGCMAIGTGLAFFLSHQPQIEKQPCPTDGTPIMPLSKEGSLIATFALLFDKKMLLLIPLLIYIGLQKAFVWGSFTANIITPALGISWVGGVMAACGAADSIFSWIAGRYSNGMRSIWIITYSGAFAQIIVLVCLLLKQSYSKEISGYLELFFFAILWGIGDAIFNTQISALLPILCAQNTEAGFALWKIWESLAISFSFFLSNHIALTIWLEAMAVVLLVSTLFFSILMSGGQKELSTKACANTQNAMTIED